MKSSIVASVLSVLVAGCSASTPDTVRGIAIVAPDGTVQVIGVDGEAAAAPISGEADVRLPIQPTPGPGNRLIWVDNSATAPTVSVWSDDTVAPVGTPFIPFYFSWSPDGSRVAMLGNGSDGVTGTIYELETAKFVDLGTATPFVFDWAPDSTRLIAHLGGTETHVIDAASGRRTLVLPDSVGFAAPQYLPDGRVLTVRAATSSTAAASAQLLSVAALAQEAGYELIVTDVEAAATRVLASVGPRTAFAAAGGQVAFVTGAADSALLFGSLELLELDGSGRTTITEDEVLSFEWSPDGTKLLYFTLDREAATLTPSVWDGTTSTAYESYRPTELAASQYLPFADQYSRSQTAWAVDGSAFTYAERTDGGSMIVLQTVDGTATRIAVGESATWMR